MNDRDVDGVRAYHERGIGGQTIVSEVGTVSVLVVDAPNWRSLRHNMSVATKHGPSTTETLLQKPDSVTTGANSELR